MPGCVPRNSSGWRSSAGRSVIFGGGTPYNNKQKNNYLETNYKKIQETQSISFIRNEIKDKYLRRPKIQTVIACTGRDLREFGRESDTQRCRVNVQHLINNRLMIVIDSADGQLVRIVFLTMAQQGSRKYRRSRGNGDAIHRGPVANGKKGNILSTKIACLRRHVRGIPICHSNYARNIDSLLRWLFQSITARLF